MSESQNSLAGTLGRMAGSRAARQRVLGALWSGAAATARSFARVLHVLFLEVTGLLFVCLTIGFASVAVREYYKYKAGTAPQYKVALAVAFTLMFFWFGVTSFWRARSKRK